jgi:hypothetical protein
MNTLTPRDLGQHVTILAWILIILNAIGLAVGIFVFFLLSGVGAITGETDVMAILVMVGTFVAVLMTALSLPGMAAGYGLLRRRAWGRILAILVLLVGLVNVPVGTILGIYGLWVLFQGEAATYFDGESPATA